jgi:hypothetical protein
LDAGARHTNARIRFLSRIICWDLCNALDPILNCIGNMRDNLYGFAQIRALLIVLAPLVLVTPDALKHAVGAYLFFLPIARGWQRSILAKCYLRE